jgi:hypothetical protein
MLFKGEGLKPVAFKLCVTFVQLAPPRQAREHQRRAPLAAAAAAAAALAAADEGSLPART